MKPTISIRKALADKKLLGDILVGDSWQAWRVLLIAAMGEPLTDAERETFTVLTGRQREPGQRIEVVSQGPWQSWRLTLVDCVSTS